MVDIFLVDFMNGLEVGNIFILKSKFETRKDALP